MCFRHAYDSHGQLGQCRGESGGGDGHRWHPHGQHRLPKVQSNRDVWPPLLPWEHCHICRKERDEEEAEEEYLAEVEVEKEDAGKEEEEKAMADEEKAGGGKVEEGEEDVEAVQGVGRDDEWVDALEAALEDKWAVDLEGMVEEEEVVEVVVVEDGKEVEVEAAEQLVPPPKRRRWRCGVLAVSSSLQP